MGRLRGKSDGGWPARRMLARRWPVGLVVVMVAVGSLGLSACVADPPPTMGTAIAGDGRAVVSWQAPLASPSPTTAYVVTPWIGFTSQTPVVFSSPAAMPQTVTGLTNGTTYTFTVHAVNANGDESAESAMSNPVTPSARFPTFTATPPAAPPVLVQSKSQQVQTGDTNTLSFDQNTAAGNLIVVSMVWDNTGGAYVSDSQGNTWAANGIRQPWGTGWGAKTMYAQRIVGGADTITVSFISPITSFGTVSINEYAGIDKAGLTAVDGTAAAAGSGSAMTSNAVTTADARDFLYGFGASNGAVTAPGAGFTARSMTFGTITEDRLVDSAGPYAATATQNSTAWVMQMIAFRAAPSDVYTRGESVATADFNGDGHLDVAAAVGPGVSVLLGDGTGRFGRPTLFPAGPVGGGGVAVDTGDFNGDGHVDLAVVSTNADGSSGTASVLLGDGSGNFGPPTNVAALPDVPTSVTVSDLNGDGFADVVAADRSSVAVLIGDGSGTHFTTTGLGLYAFVNSVQIADLNSDNVPDLVVVDRGANLGYPCSYCLPKLQVWFGNGAGGFSSSVSLPTPQLGVNSVAVADVNGDGHADLVVSMYHDSTSASVLFGDGAGNFPNQTTVATGGASVMAVGDVNNDGFPDLVVAAGYNSVSVLIGDGTGNFGARTADFATGDDPMRVVIGNLDGDARPDLVVANYYSASVSVLLSTTPPTTPTAPTILRNATAADQSATISWLTPAGDGGSPITGYVITPYIGFDVQPSITFDSTVTTQTVTGLTNGTTYHFKVGAINAVGTGPMSTVTNPVTPGV